MLHSRENISVELILCGRRFVVLGMWQLQHCSDSSREATWPQVFETEPQQSHMYFYPKLQ